ncbi:MAG: hypothetical protein LBS68_03095 [Puniceicoccales bacterium]|jgi:hypothetical protein|nr:hypothetical protein [Puniceicoccales bacterium]
MSSQDISSHRQGVAANQIGPHNRLDQGGQEALQLDAASRVNREGASNPLNPSGRALIMQSKRAKQNVFENQASAPNTPQAKTALQDMAEPYANGQRPTKGEPTGPSI